MFCLFYSIFSTSGYESAQTIYLKEITFMNLSIEDPYFRELSEKEGSFPSVVFLHGFVALITILFHMFLYFPIHYKLSASVWKQGFFTIRWIEYAITCTLMSISSLVSSGTNDLITILSFVFSGVALQIIGALIEQLKDQWKILLFVGVLIETNISFSLIFYSLVSSSTELQIIELIAYIVFYSLFPLNCVLNAGFDIPFQQTDWYYNVLSLSSKFGLFWIQVGEVHRNLYTNSLWSFIQIYVLGVFFPVIFLIFGYLLRPQNTTEVI